MPQSSGRVRLPKFVKDVLGPGSYRVGDQVVKVTSGDLKRFADTFRNMKASGLRVPVPWEHPAVEDEEGYPVNAADKARLKAREQAKFNAGWTDELYVDDADGKLKSVVDIPRDDDAAKVKDIGTFVSPQFGPYKDDSGTDWGIAVTHLALTPRPVNTQQSAEFVPVAMSKARELGEVIRFSLHDQVQMSAGTMPRERDHMAHFRKEKSQLHAGLHGEFSTHKIPQALHPHGDGSGYHNTHTIGEPGHKPADMHKTLMESGYKHVGGNAYKSPRGRQFTLHEHKHGAMVRAVPTSVVRFSQIQFAEQVPYEGPVGKQRIGHTVRDELSHHNIHNEMHDTPHGHPQVTSPVILHTAHNHEPAHHQLLAAGYKHHEGTYTSPAGHSFSLEKNRKGSQLRIHGHSETLHQFSQIQFSEKPPMADDDKEPEKKPEENPEAPKPEEKAPEPKPAEPEVPGAGGQLDALRTALAGFGIVIPDTIKLSGDLDALIAAVASAKAATDLYKNEDKTDDDADTLKEEPATVAMSKDANKKTETPAEIVQMSATIKELVDLQTASGRKDYARRIANLFESGRIDKPTREKLDALTGQYQFSVGTKAGNSELDTRLECYESLPEGAVFTVEQKQQFDTQKQMSKGVQEQPHNHAFFSKDGQGVSDERAQEIVDEMFGKKKK